MSRKDKQPQEQAAEVLQQIEQLTTEKQELTDKLQRLSADYANYQKRVPRQIADAVSYEKKNIIRSLLPSLDNFEHALGGSRSSEAAPAPDKVIEGIGLVYDHMLDALKSCGVEKIVSSGRPFDPGFHEAMLQRAEPDKPDNIVLDELQAGYTLNGQVLRPARVAVNKLPAAPVSPPPAPQEETTDTEQQ